MALKDKLMTLEDFKAVRDVDVASNSAQFTEIKADLGALMEPQRLADGTDLNNVTTPGTYMLHGSMNYINKPTEGAENGLLEVWHEDYNNLGRTCQRLTYTYKEGRTHAEIWIRLKSVISGATWTPWASVVNVDKLNSGIWSAEAKNALLSCFENVLWGTSYGKTLVRSLREALGMSRKRSDLPSAYEQVEYIEGTGTQWVTLDINSQIPMSVETEILFTRVDSNVFTGDASSSVNSSTFRMLGFGKYESALPQGFGVRFGTHGWYLASGASGYSLNTLYTVRTGIYNNNGTNIAYIQVGEDERSEWAIQDELSTGNPMRLYKRADDTWIGRGSQFHSLKVYGGGNQLIFDGIPCYRKTDNVSGLYDTVTGTFYPSEGTDNFNIGSVVE